MNFEEEVDTISNLCSHCDYRANKLLCPINTRDRNTIEDVCYVSVMDGKPVLIASREQIQIGNIAYARAEIAGME